VVVDRSLDSSQFWSELALQPPSWREMIQKMVNDQTPYQQWRGQ